MGDRDARESLCIVSPTLSSPHSDKEVKAVFKQVDASSFCELLKTLYFTSNIANQQHVKIATYLKRNGK